MSDKDLKPLNDATEVIGRIKAKMELQERLKDLNRPLDIVTEVILWLGESDAGKKAD